MAGAAPPPGPGPATPIGPGPGGPAPQPPWAAEPQRLPPGIVLSPVVPPVFAPVLSNPRLPTEPPYERLVLISSRVHNAEQVGRDG